MKNKIMFRVKILHFVQEVLSPTGIKVFVLIFSFAAITLLVSIKNVFENMFSTFRDPVYYANYISVAFIHTRFVVQIALLVFVAVLVSVMFDLARTIKWNLHSRAY